jgi:nitrogen fixation NifU-like protein
MPGLEDLYREIILDHYRNPRNRGELPSPPAYSETGFNPLCGDEITLYLQFDGDRLEDIKLTGQGCSISQSSASMMSTAVKGRTLAETRATIRKFKAMMSIHEQRLDGADDDVPGSSGRAESAGERGDTTAENNDTAEGNGTAEGHSSSEGSRSAGGNGLGSPSEPEVALGDLEALQGVVKFPVRIKCATLSWNTLSQALDRHPQ